MHSKEKTAVFFDWGGVVADDPGDEFLAQLMQSVGANEAQVNEIFKTYMGSFMRGQITEADYWQALRTEYGLVIPDSVSDEFKEWRGLEANSDVLAYVEELKARGIAVAVLSNVIEPTYNVIRQAGYYDLFDGVIASCEVGYAKPEKKIYEIALGRFGVSAEASVFIDDKQRCLDPAEQMGFTTILAQNSVQIIRDVEACLSQ